MANNNKHAGPNVPALRFPEFSGEWESRTIGDDCKILMCKRIFANQTTPEGEVPFYKIGTIGDKADAYISKKLFEEYKQRYNYPKCGEVMITCAGTVGKTILYNGQDAYYQDSNIVWISNPRKIYSNEFLNYLLNRVDWSKLNSTTITRIYNDNLRELHITFPSREEQDKIVSLLTRIDDRIDTQSKIIEELTTLRSALNEKCAKQSGNFFPVSDILKEVEERSTIANQHQVLSSTVKGIFSQKEYFNKDIASEDNKGYKVVRKGYIVLSPQNLWMGNINYNDRFDIGIVSPSYKVFSIKQGFNPIFIAALLQTKKALNEYMLASEQGASIVRRNLNIEAFMAIKFRIPDARQQDSLSMAITAINAKLNNERCYLEQLTMQKSCLLENMFI